jgi:hypothetical protein
MVGMVEINMYKLCEHNWSVGIWKVYDVVDNIIAVNVCGCRCLYSGDTEVYKNELESVGIVKS